MLRPLHNHALQLYDLMAERAKESDDGNYHGSITATFQELGTSNGSYSAITGLLQTLGAITCLQRGARGIESIYTLGGRPTEEDFLSVALTAKANPAMLLVQQQLNDIDTRIGRLNVVEALANLESRVAKLEKESSAKSKPQI